MMENVTFFLENTTTALDNGSYDDYSYGGGNVDEGNYMYDYYTEGDIIPHFYTVKADWEVPVRGYINFLIALITILTNTLMVIVFIFRSNFSHTTVLLTTLAVSDGIICFTKMPESIYFNILGYYNEYVPYRWCVANHVFYITYQIFRITSNWITALLGFQRCISVLSPFKFKRICSIRNTVIAVVLILVTAILLNIYEMKAIEITELKIYKTPRFEIALQSGCERSFSKQVAKDVGDINKSMMLFYIFSGLLYRILPVVILCTATIILAFALRKRAAAFTSMNSNCDRSKVSQYNRITKIILAIMIVFLIAEMQDGVAFIIYAIELSSSQKRKILPEDADIKWDTVSTTLSLIGYALNFWIFFLMSKQFRSALIGTFGFVLKLKRPKVILDMTENDTASTNDKLSSADTDSAAL